MIDKLTKYDRQLRLWESLGQQKLETSHICLINATATGAELLKNLVLPGIGQFTIISPEIVNEDSLSGNFFLDEDDIGTPIAEAMVKKLTELNHEVKGHAIIDSVANISEDWYKFNAVIVSDYLPLSQLDALNETLWNQQTPLFITQTVGFYGTLNLIVPETTVIETHDPSKLNDLRIDRPWPELQEYSDSIHLDQLSDVEHAHIPYIIIYLKALEAWKRDYSEVPQNYSQKKLFRTDYIEKMSRNLHLEANFAEAATSIHRALQVTKVPESIAKLFQNVKLKNLSEDSSLFWLYVKALEVFVDANSGQLPLAGSIPDMASDTSSYVALQNIFKRKSEEDLAEFKGYVVELAQEVGIASEITNELLKLFCKNCAYLHVTEGSKKIFSIDLLSQLSKDADTLLPIYFAILTFNAFIDLHGKPPAVEDIDQFVNVFIEVFAPNQLPNMLPETLVSTLKEVTSHNTRSYHNLCSLIGGVCSQEVLKSLTNQYIPLDNLYIFDGIKSTSEKIKI